MTHKTLRELWRTDRAAAIEIIDAIDRDDPVECLQFRRWNIRKSTQFHLDCVYRLAPRDPVIDWSQIGVEVVAVAMDQDTSWWGIIEPDVEYWDGAWFGKYGIRYPLELWPKAFIPGHGISAKDSLRLRPKEGE